MIGKNWKNTKMIMKEKAKMEMIKIQKKVNDINRKNYRE